MSTSLSHRLAIIWADLEHVVRSLGRSGGLLTPSVYDTAQCVRFNPPANPWPVIDWLLGQQQPDGGWTLSPYPQMRLLSTLSALLALKTLSYARRSTQAAIDNGLAFLYRHQWSDWSGSADSCPIGMDVIFTRLLEEAHALGLAIDVAPYALLMERGERQRARLQRSSRTPEAAMRHSWEAWGEEPLPSLVDHLGTVGGSPAASAFWLSRARSDPRLAELCELVETGLRQAGTATACPIDHVVCARWPMTDDERIFGLYLLVLGGMVGTNHKYSLPAPFRIALDQQLVLLRDTLLNARTDALGKALLDPEQKALAITVLAASGQRLPRQMTDYFAQTALAHTSRWADAAPPHPSAVAHTLHALVSLGFGAACKEYQAHLHRCQEPTGLWRSQPPYMSMSSQSATAQIMIALLDSGTQATIPALCHTLAMFQRSDGAWGDGAGCIEETSYAVLSLLAAHRHRCLPEQLMPVLAKAMRWMCDHYHPFNAEDVPLWRGKEPYRPLRIARVAELTALIGLLHVLN